MGALLLLATYADVQLHSAALHAIAYAPILPNHAGAGYYRLPFDALDLILDLRNLAAQRLELV